jgi:hypothetical protein
MHTLISSILAALTAVAASAFGLVLLAVASYASGSAAHAQSALNNRLNHPLNHPLPTKQSAAAEGDSIRLFHVDVPEEIRLKAK